MLLLGQRSELSDSVNSSNLPPTEIIIESAIAFFLILIAQLLPLRLKPITISAKVRAKSFPEVLNPGTDFMTFDHRGPVIA
eukprot:gene9817-13210_t